MNIRKFVNSHKTIIENYSYMSVLQIFILLYPLITYPYLVGVLGTELYGYVLTAQMLASYAALFVDFGSNYVCAKHISTNRNNQDKLSEIFSNVLSARFFAFLFAFVVYTIIVFCVPDYRSHALIFLLMYGFTTQEFLFPQFVFQGLEKMKMVSIINVVSKFIFLPLIFVLVKNPSDVWLVPVIYTLGYLLSGILSLYMIVKRYGIRFKFPSLSKMGYYIKDSSAIFATDVVCTIKDKFNYFLIGSCVGMSEIVVYDLSLKLNTIISKPFLILLTVMFPRQAQTKSLSRLKQTVIISLGITFVLTIIANIFLADIVDFFLHEEIDLLPVRIMMLAPIILSISGVIANNYFVAFGHNKFVFYSIVFTTIIYLLSLLAMFILGCLNTIMSFVCLSIVSYLAELIYRTIKAYQLIYNKNNNYEIP